jgi:hypothetical protein
MMRFICLLLFLASMIPDAHANETGSIFGVITDKETGNPIAYANVVVEGTTLDALSGDDGSYVITGIPAGEYTLRAMMFGYTTQKKYRIAVGRGSPVEVNFVLEKRGD